jgi:hypothetical protein
VVLSDIAAGRHFLIPGISYLALLTLGAHAWAACDPRVPGRGVIGTIVSVGLLAVTLAAVFRRL